MLRIVFSTTPKGINTLRARINSVGADTGKETEIKLWTPLTSQQLPMILLGRKI